MMNERFLVPSILSLAAIACGGAPSTNVQSQSDSGATIATHCDTATSASVGLCIENAEGHAGEVIDVPVYLLGSANCTDAMEASGHIVADANSFALANPVQQVDCVSRDYYAAPAAGTIEIMWNAFGAGSIGACPNDIVPGKLDTVKIEILPGTPPGDYALSWSDTTVAGNTMQCSAFGASGGLPGTLRVLP